MCASDIESESLTDYFGCNNIPQCMPCPPKDLCPLKSFCDPGFQFACERPPLVNPNGPKRAITTWRINYLTSNLANEASHLDTNLVLPRGIVIFNNQLWITNLMSDTITNYDLFGNKLLGSILVRWTQQISSFPAGLAVNCDNGFNFTAVGGAPGSEFSVGSGSGLLAAGTGVLSNGFSFSPSAGVPVSATFLTGTRTGDVIAINPAADPKRGYVIINNKSSGEVAVYSGIALVNGVLYLADFFQGHIDVFGSDLVRIGVQGRNFVDNFSQDPIPTTFSPFNIVYIAPFMYIVYAERTPGLNVHHIEGAGRGFISVFTLDGGFVKRFYSRGVLNAPWSIIPAPNECGIPPGSFLVNNIGDGRINMFDSCGNFIGPMLAQSGIPIVINQLQSIAPYYTTFNEIFFTSSDLSSTKGLLGSLVKDQIIYI
jgi:uncharacterized protein (TIGR03118 family)